MTQNNSESRKKLNALDIFIILAVVMCVTVVGIRIYTGDSGEIIGKPAAEMGDYLLSFLILDVRETSADYYNPGDVFTLASSTGEGDPVGFIVDTPTFTPAEIYIENDEGEYLIRYSTEEGDDARIDIRGTFQVSGTMTEEGFLLNGKTYLAPNKVVTIQSNKMYVNMIVIDITKVS